MLAEITAEELYAELDAVAAEVLAEVGVEGPPVDAFAVADALRIAVALDDHQQGRARYVRLRAFRGSRPMRAKPKTQQNLQTSAHRARKLQSETLKPSMPTTQQNLQTSAHRVQKLQSETLKPSILLRPDPRAERRQWAVAHEIGEHVAWRVFGRLGVDPREAGPDSRESVANQLAGRLLLPGEWFEADAVACGWDLLELKSCYRTASHELIARRMLEFGPPVIVTVFDHARVSFRRSNLPGRVPNPSETELDCWQTVHRRNRPWHVEAGGQTVVGWPVHEKDWRREILRTEVDIWSDCDPSADF